MARDGSGGYSLPESAFVFETVIDETAVNSNFSDIATEIANSVDKDGQTTWTGNMNAGSKKITSMAVGTANADSLTLGQAQDGGFLHLGSVSGTDTITAALTPAITAYATGQKFTFVSAGANTGATTININSVGAKAITKEGTTALAAGDIPSGAMAEIVYDGTRFQLLNIGGLLLASNNLSDVDTAATALSNIGGIGAATSDTLTNKTLGAVTLSGEVSGADQTVTRVNLKDYGEITNALGDLGGGTDDIDVTAGNSVSATVSTSTQTFTFSNPTASDELCAFSLMLTNGGSQTVNWPASVDWASGVAPSLTASGVDCLVFWTIDGGTIWNGAVVGLDLS